MSYIAGFFLVFAGMLIGYFLWYRDRSEDDSARLRLLRENEDLQQALQQLRGQQSTLESRCSRQKGQLNVLQQLCDDWSTGREQSDRERANLEAELTKHRARLDESLAQLELEKKKRISLEDQLQQQFENLQAENQQLQSDVRTMESLSQRNEDLLKSIDDYKEELVRVTGQRDKALAAEQAAKTVGAGLQTRIDNQEATIHGLRDSRNEVMQKLKQQMDDRSQFEGSFESERSELLTRIKRQEVELQRRSKEREHTVNEQLAKLGELEAQISKQDETIQQLTSQRDELLTERAEIRERLATALKTATQSDEQRKRLEAEVDEVATMQVRIRELESLLKRREAEMQQLDMSGEEAELLRGQFSSLQDQFAIARRRQKELEAKLQQLNQERDYGQPINDGTQSQLAQVKARLSASEETIRKLRRERAAVLARLSNYRTVVEQPTEHVIPFSEAMRQQKTAREGYDQEYGGPTTVHAKRGVVFTAEPETRDDLKRISGIAEILEARLNDYGIYTFKQIIDWTEAEVAEFSELLSFPDRIQRDGWQGQAQFFYKQKHEQKKVA